MELFHLLFILFFKYNFISSTVQGLSVENIIGGEEVGDYDFKYVVALMYYPRDGNIRIMNTCTGSLVSQQHFITVAHCFYDENAALINKEFFIVVSESEILDPPNRKRHRVQYIIMPDFYDPNTPDTYAEMGNLAIGQLAHKLPSLSGNRSLKKLKIAKRLYQVTGDDYTVAGFGWDKIEIIHDSVTGLIQEIKGSSDGKLRYAFTDLLNESLCQSQILEDYMANGNMCVKIKDNEFTGKGICQGDSGAPLVRGDYLCGIAIHGFAECNENLKPAIYIDVTYYSSYINAVIKGSRVNSRTFELVQYPNNVFEFVEDLR